VNEVVLSVQYPSAVVDEVTALADFWPKIRTDFPQLERQPPIVPAVEEFGPPRRQPQVEFRMLSEPPTQRYWFIEEAGNRLVQVQADRFLLNWRKVSDEDGYPRYRNLRSEFESRYATFAETVSAEAVPEVDWCEVTYINHIPAEGNRPAEHMQLSKVLKVIAEQPVGEALPPPEDSQLQERFVIRDGEAPVGRLYLTATPAYRTADDKPIYVVTLLARGRPRGQGLQGVLEFFDLGRDLIVRGFKELTTDQMHQTWGLVSE
jgi:uncharacterized protein (TIGR04255 family)